MDSKGSAFGPAQGMEVRARANDIKITDSADSSGTIGSSSADVTWSTDGILATLQAQPLGGMITAVTADPTAGTLKVSVGGFADMTVQPKVQDGKIDVETVSAAILGGWGCRQHWSTVSSRPSPTVCSSTRSAWEPTALTVTDSGIDVNLQGGEYVMPAADPNAQSGCSLL
ncbi:LmeA family phospholipid-binding protein [Rhodococcus hoagii]|nr:LmeA family phospholipid-binding protein [Prescottella equi]